MKKEKTQQKQHSRKRKQSSRTFDEVSLHGAGVRDHRHGRSSFLLGGRGTRGATRAEAFRQHLRIVKIENSGKGDTLEKEKQRKGSSFYRVPNTMQTQQLKSKKNHSPKIHSNK